jgi:hypothetical protein
MRFFCCLFSIYIVFLTAIPCADKLEDRHVQQTQVTDDSPVGHHHHDGDECSPFCTCNCCASPVIQQDFIVQFNCLNIIQEFPTPEYTSRFTSSYCCSIWQPPQMS